MYPAHEIGNMVHGIYGGKIIVRAEDTEIFEKGKVSMNDMRVGIVHFLPVFTSIEPKTIFQMLKELDNINEVTSEPVRFVTKAIDNFFPFFVEENFES